MKQEVKLGEFLVSSKIITEDELESALDYQKEHGGKLNEILVNTKTISEDRLLAALRYYLGIPVIDMEKITVNAEIIALLPKEMAKKHKVIPVKIQEIDKKKTLYVAMSDPLDLDAIANVGFKTGLKIQPVLCTEGDILFSLDRYYGGKSDEASYGDLDEGAGKASINSLEKETVDKYRMIKEASEFLQKKAEKGLDIDAYYSTLSKERELIRAMINILIKKGIITPDDIKGELTDK